MKRPGHRSLRGLLVAAAAALVLPVACGLPTDHSPRAIDTAEVPDLVTPSTGPQTTQAGPGAPTAKLYYVKGSTLLAVTKAVKSTDPASVLRLLLTGLTAKEKASGLITYVPPRTRLLRASLAGNGTLLIDLSKDINTITGQNAKTAYAQLVFTATSLRGVERVRFDTEGSAVAVPTDEANQEIVDQASYNNPYQVVGGGPSGTSSGTSTTVATGVRPAPTSN